MTKRLAESTPVAKMGMGRTELAKLSAAGQKLTKGDLVALWEDRITPTAAKATLGDVELIKAGFAPAMRGGQVGFDIGDVNCCCCPCCCATAVVRPLRAVA